MNKKIITVMLIGVMVFSGLYIIIANGNFTQTQSYNVLPYSAIANTGGTNMSQNYVSIGFENYTLPHFSEYEMVDKGIITDASLVVGQNSENYLTAYIMSRHNIFNTLGFYYINESNDLVFTNYFTNQTLILESNVLLPKVYGLTSDGYGYLNYYQDINGTIQYLYWYGYYHSYYYVNVYNAFTGQNTFLNTTIKNITASGLEYQFEIFNCYGDILFNSNQADTVYVITLSGQIYTTNVANFDFPQGNSPEYFIGRNSFEESFTNTSCDIIFTIVGFNLTTHKFTNITLSGFTVSGATDDNNNNPLYEKILSNGTLLVYGKSANNPSTVYNYNFNGIYVFNNTSKDTMAYNFRANSNYDSELQSNNVIISQSGLIQQQTHGYPYSSDRSVIPYQQFFPNPTDIQLYYSTNVWFNNIFNNESYSNNEVAYSLNDVGSYNGYMNVFNTNFSESLSTTNWNILIYWLTANTSLTAIKNTNNLIAPNFSNQPTNITIYYHVFFRISGLPLNTSWAVVINGSEYISNDDVIEVNLTAGIYNPIFVIPNGYTENDIGMFSVSKNMTYFIQISQSPFLFLQNNLAYIIVFLFIMMILILAIAVRGRRE
jgi:hypothetical protein